jgi:hypothetical protein
VDFRNGAPSRFNNVRALSPLLSERGNLGNQIVVHQIQFGLIVRISGMNRGLERGQSEEQPAVTGVHSRETENVPEKRPISRGIPAIDDNVCTEDHSFLPSFQQCVL